MLVTSSSLTPALGALTRALASRKGEVRLQELFARDIPDFATGDGKGLPDKATVDVVEIRNKDLVMAFLRFSPPGHRRCDDTGPDAETRVLYVGRAKDGVERIRLTEEFSAADTQIFDGKRVNVVFPPIAPAVVEVHYDYESPCESLDSSGQRVELFHLASRERIGDPISVYATRAVPGMSTVEQAKLAWFKSTELGAAFLAITRFNTETVTPCTGETVDRSAACRPQFGCVRTTKLLVVSAESVTNAEGVDELKRAHPALSKLPPDLTANSKAGCQKLEPR